MLIICPLCAAPYDPKPASLQHKRHQRSARCGEGFSEPGRVISPHDEMIAVGDRFESLPSSSSSVLVRLIDRRDVVVAAH